MSSSNKREYKRNKSNDHGSYNPDNPMRKKKITGLTDRLLQEANQQSGYDLLSLLDSKAKPKPVGLTSYDDFDASDMERWKIQSFSEYHSYMARWCRERAPFLRDEKTRKLVWEQSYQHQEAARLSNEYLLGRIRTLPKLAPINMVLGRRN